MEDRDAVAAAVKYHERLKKEFASATMIDMGTVRPGTSKQKPAGVMADERLAEMRGVWAGLPKIVLAGEPAPEVEGLDLDGNKIKLSDFKGKVVLLRILEAGISLTPKVDIPVPKKKKGVTPNPGRFALEQSMMERFKDKPFVCVLVCWDASKAGIGEFLKKEKVDWPVIRMRGYSGDYSKNMRKDWPSRSSQHFIIDAQGNVRLREYTFPREIGETLEGIFSEKK